MATLFCDNVKLKIYLNIENNLFRAHETAQDLKKIQISTLMGIILFIFSGKRRFKDIIK